MNFPLNYQMCNPTLKEALTQIARQHMRVPTLEVRRGDALDFHEVSVWGVEEALLAAYRLGVEMSMGSTQIESEE